MREQSLQDNRHMNIACEAVNKKKRNQQEGRLGHIALDYCFIAPLVVMFDE
jgi:hypothetical protein